MAAIWQIDEALTDTSCTMIAGAYNRDSMSSPVKISTTTPERSQSQRMRALKRANQIRSSRARLKRDLKRGNKSIDRLLFNCPDYIKTAKVFDLLVAVPKLGRVKVNRILTQCRISPSKTVGGLSERQRAELVSYLRFF